MAQEGIHPIFESGGRGGNYNLSPYASSYATGKGIMEMIDWQDKKRREELEEQLSLSKEKRAEDYEKIAQQREQEKYVLDMQKANRMQSRQDLYEKRMDDLDKLAGIIDQVDSTHKDATKQLMDVRNTPEFHRLLANRDTRQALNEVWKSKTGEVKDIRDGIQSEASKYGVDVDFENLPIDKNGVYDFKSIYGDVIPSMAKQRQMRIAQEMQASQMAASAAGYNIVPVTTPEGKVTTRLVKKDQTFGVPTGKAPTTEPSKPAQLPSLSDFAKQYQSIQQQSMTQPVEGVDSLEQ
jgi:hypothetical protein